MKPGIAVLALCIAASSGAQTSDVAAVEAQLARARNQLQVVIRTSPPPLPLVNMPGESDTQRAQRHQDAIERAQESWRAEWSASHPFEYSMNAGALPPDLEREAIQESDEQAIAKYKAKHSETVESAEIVELRHKIAFLESQLKKMREGQHPQAPNRTEARQAREQQSWVAAHWREVKLGMSRDVVRQLLGDPNAENKERWIYTDGGTIKFNDKGVITYVGR